MVKLAGFSLRLDLENSKSLHVGSFYRPPGNNEASVEGLKNFMVANYSDPAQKHLILGGDFNFPDIDWTNNFVSPLSPHPNLSRAFLDVVNSNNLEQLVDQPTRGNNILDLYLTNQPTLVKKTTVAHVIVHQYITIRTPHTVRTSTIRVVLTMLLFAVCITKWPLVKWRCVFMTPLCCCYRVNLTNSMGSFFNFSSSIFLSILYEIW